ncbi:hypothetical protein ACOMHN_037767 [Nucella lapillus]
MKCVFVLLLLVSVMAVTSAASDTAETLTPLHSRLHHRYSRVVNPATPLLSRLHHHCRRAVNPLPWHSRLHHRRAGWSTKRCPQTLDLIIDIAAVS